MSKNHSTGLLYEINHILDRHKDKGWEVSRSGRLNMNGRNYAQDIISAIDYVRSLLNDANHLTKNSAIQLIESHQDDYERIYIDPEGFGCGTMNEIIADIKVLK